MKQIKPGELHVLIVARLDGGVGLFYTRTPAEWLGAFGNHLDIGEVEVRCGQGAPEIVAQLRARFAAAHLPGESMPWYLIDFGQAVTALDEYDLDTGESRLPIALNTEVMVFPQRCRGHVFGFTNRGRSVAVKLVGEGATALLIVPRGKVKPIYRVVVAA